MYRNNGKTERRGCKGSVGNRVARTQNGKQLEQQPGHRRIATTLQRLAEERKAERGVAGHERQQSYLKQLQEEQNDVLRGANAFNTLAQNLTLGNVFYQPCPGYSEELLLDSVLQDKHSFSVAKSTRIHVAPTVNLDPKATTECMSKLPAQSTSISQSKSESTFNLKAKAKVKPQKKNELAGPLEPLVPVSPPLQPDLHLDLPERLRELFAQAKRMARNSPPRPMEAFNRKQANNGGSPETTGTQRSRTAQRAASTPNLFLRLSRPKSRLMGDLNTSSRAQPSATPPRKRYPSSIRVIVPKPLVKLDSSINSSKVAPTFIPLNSALFW